MPFLKINAPPKPVPPPHKCVTPGGNYDSLVGVGSFYQCPICGIIWRKEGPAHWMAWEFDAMPLDADKLVPDPLATRGYTPIDEIARNIEAHRLAQGVL